MAPPGVNQVCPGDLHPTQMPTSALRMREKDIEYEKEKTERIKIESKSSVKPIATSRFAFGCYMVLREYEHTYEPRKQYQRVR